MGSRASVFPPSDKLCDLLAEIAGAKIDEGVFCIFERLSERHKLRKFVAKEFYYSLLVALFDEDCHDVDERIKTKYPTLRSR